MGVTVKLRITLLLLLLQAGRTGWLEAAGERGTGEVEEFRIG